MRLFLTYANVYNISRIGLFRPVFFSYLCLIGSKITH